MKRRKIKEKRRNKILAELSHGKILDIGFNSMPNPFLRGDVIGMDIKITKRPKNYKKFVKGDCHELSRSFKKNSFDTIIAGEVIEHLENPSKFLRECKKVLKKKGRIILSTPNPYDLVTIFANITLSRKYVESSDHINLFPYRNMLKLLKHCGLKCEKVVQGSGMRIPFVNVFLPTFKGLSFQLIYIIKK